MNKAEPVFFPDAAALRLWFEQNHATAAELHLGYYKTASGIPSVSWPDSVDEALCVGWIDGVRRSLGADSYTIRFTPRKPTSIWSAINIAKIEKLIAEGRMKPEGLAAYNKRKENKTAIYAYENEHKELPEKMVATFRKNKKAWAYFSSLAPSYQRLAIHSITGAKREATQLARLQKIIEACARQEKFWLYNQ